MTFKRLVFLFSLTILSICFPFYSEAMNYIWWEGENPIKNKLSSEDLVFFQFISRKPPFAFRKPLVDQCGKSFG